MNPDSAKERGNRVRYMRIELLHVSRNALVKKYTDLLSMSAIQNWEDGRYGGLTEKGAKKLIEVFARENIDCSLQWLLYGIGSAPVNFSGIARFSLNSADIITDKQPPVTDEEAIHKELRFFKAIHVDTMDAIVRDDALSPILTIGDYVAGIRWTGKEINQAIGQLCIIQTYDGLFLTRKLEASPQPGYYKLVCTNLDTLLTLPLANNVKLFSVASIVWVRKPLKTSPMKMATIATD
jgi:hypothetical protein